MNFIRELKRRNVIRVGAAYLVASWLLLQVLDVVGDIVALPESLARHVLFLLAAAFLPVLIIAWVYELTPQGIKLESEVDRDSSITPRTGHKLDRAIIVILALAVAMLLFDKLALQEGNEPRLATEPGKSAMEPAAVPVGPAPVSRSVVVLPFAVMSNGLDDNYFADGLTEEIINSLAQMPGLLVTARTSAFHFKGRNEPIDVIANRLGVAHVVEGSVRRAGDQLRITAQLIRAADGFHLWSETYDRRTEDTFNVQTDIAAKIAEALNVFLDERTRQQIQRSGTRNVDAFIDLQKGIELYERAHAEPNQISLLRQANRELAQAASLEPELFATYELQTDLYAHILISNASGIIDGEITPEDVQTAPQALDDLYELAVRYASTAGQRNTMVFSKALVSGSWRGLKQLSLDALRQTGCNVSLWHQILAAPFGQEREALAAFNNMLTCDPLRAQGYVHSVGSQLWNGQAAQTVAAEQSEAIWVANPLIVQFLSMAQALQGDAAAAQSSARRFIRDERPLLEALAQLAAIEGKAEESRALEADLVHRFGNNDRMSLTLAALRGERNEANRLAGLIDSRTSSHMVLLQAIYFCVCGAPFDLEATPNFAALFSESGFSWPPSQPYEFPLKDW